MPDGVRRGFQIWLSALLVGVAGYEAWHLVEINGPKDRAGLIFLALLLGVFVTVGLTAEMVIESSLLRRLTLTVFYAGAVSIFFYTSLRENRALLIQRIQVAQEAQRFNKTVQMVRNRAAEIRKTTIASRDNQISHLKAAQQEVNTQIALAKTVRLTYRRFWMQHAAVQGFAMRLKKLLARTEPYIAENGVLQDLRFANGWR